MIISKISHGLGNQLFQYAIARKLALSRRTSLYLDLRYYHHVYATDTFRSFRLHHFGISYKVLDTSPLLIYLSKATKLLPQRSLPPLCKLLKEKNGRFNADVLSEKSLVLYLSGFWQSEKYFKDIQPTLQAELVLRTPPSAYYTAYLEQIRQCPTPISLHIRRGDYVQNANFSNQFGFLGLDYYEKAVQYLTSRLSDCTFFIFSDDLDWVKANLSLKHPTVFVENNSENSDLEELMLMRSCAHHIIANSSFSWWGAWLNERPDKLVVAPARWYNNMPDLTTNDLIPEEWVRM